MSTAYGYTCSVCRTWVPSGVYHSCKSYPTNVTPPVASDAIALALGRIEALLQQIVRKLESPQ